MQEWKKRAKGVEPLKRQWRERAKTRLLEQTRPAGSLGRLEEMIEKLVAIQENDRLNLSKKRILIFAADHGVEEEGVSAYPREVTKAMVLNFLNGGATINALARSIGADVKVVDVGVDGEFADHKDLIRAKVRPGTRSMVRECAMTEEELDQALKTGWDCVVQARVDGAGLLGLGEMGIGNTTAASAIAAALLKVKAESVTGRGTGIDEDARRHKVEVIERAIDLHLDKLQDPFYTLQSLGGYEIAAMTGAILAAACLRMPLVVDGWVVASSVLAAYHMNPLILEYLFFAHQSAEKGHGILFERLGAKPLLEFSMRLGEASGAALAMGILESSARVYNEVTTFKEAEVSTAS